MKRGVSNEVQQEKSTKRRKEKHDNYKQGVVQCDRDGQTVTWLDCETNFSEKWIDSVRTTSDHSKSDQHLHAINLHRKELAQTQNMGPSFVYESWVDHKSSVSVLLSS